LLEVEVLEAPQIRYTQENQTPLAEMAVRVEGLRPDDPPGQIKVVGWGNLAQDLQNRVRVGQRLVLEGRLRMNMVARADGVKEKRAEFTISRLHPLSEGGLGATAGPVPSIDQPPASSGGRTAPPPPPPMARAADPQRQPVRSASGPPPTQAGALSAEPPVWNTSPLNPDDMEEGDDEIPF
jgi:single-strand DNA-binding protein